MPTLEFSFTTTTANITRAIQGVAYQNKYQDEIDDPDNPGEMIPNPETKAQFAKRMIKEYIINNVRAWEANQAADAARTAAIEAVEDEVEIT